MRKIIKNKVYDTNTAKLLGDFSYSNPRDFNYISEELYRKKNGEFFLYGEGGARSRYAERIEQNTWSGGSTISPLSFDAARQWAEDHLTAEEYESIFGEVSEDDTREMVTYSISARCAELVRRAASMRGVSQADVLEGLISSGLDTTIKPQDKPDNI